MVNQFLSLLEDAKKYINENKDEFIVLNNEEIKFYENDIIKDKSIRKTSTILQIEKPKEKIILEKPKKIEKKEPPPPASLPPPPKEEIPKEEKPFLETKKNEIATSNLSGIKEDFTLLFPNIPIIKEIPSDRMAIKILNKWKYKNQAAEITILAYMEKDKKTLNFLESFAKALDIYFYPARVVQAQVLEEEDQWEFFLSSQRLKIIIASDYSIFALKKLMRFYKELPNSSKHFLLNVPLFILPEVSLYIKNPLLKASLWKAIKQKISITIGKNNG